MKSDNNWYGHRSIFSDYIGQKNQPTFSTIQHGYLNKFYLLRYNELPKIKLIPYLCWNLETKARYNKLGFNNVHIVGAPFVYLSKMIKLKKRKNSNRVLFFPPHNTIDYKIHDLNHSELGDKLLSIYKKKSITVCLYYLDYKNKKIVKLYKKKGFKVISIVSRNNINSLKNLYRRIYKNDYIVVCDISSVLFYSMFLKKKVKVLLKNENETYLTKKIKNDEKFTFYFKKKYPNLFKKELGPKKGYLLACEYLGYKYLRSKDELKNLLGWDSKIKMLIAKCFSYYYDIKLSKEFRFGEKNKKII